MENSQSDSEQVKILKSSLFLSTLISRFMVFILICSVVILILIATGIGFSREWHMLMPFIIFPVLFICTPILMHSLSEITRCKKGLASLEGSRLGSLPEASVSQPKRGVDFVETGTRSATGKRFIFKVSKIYMGFFLGAMALFFLTSVLGSLFNSFGIDKAISKIFDDKYGVVIGYYCGRIYLSSPSLRIGLPALTR
jgi:hypothetical protein